MGAGLVELLVNGLIAEPEDPVLPRNSGPEVRALFDEPLPHTGSDPEQLLRRVEQLFERRRKNGHPRFFGYVCASADPIGVLFDAIASSLNQNVTAWRSAPQAAEMERVVLRWLDELVGFAGGGHGLLVSGGSAANATALACALRSVAEREGAELADLLPRIIVYRTSEAHLSLDKALRVFGVATRNRRTIATDGERRMDPDELERTLQADRSQGLLPACICASAGTANTGAIDPLERIGSVARGHGVWFHVDGAYGAPAATTESYSFLRRGFALADSLSLDPHKWLFAPLDVGCILLRDAEASRRTFSLDSEYTAVQESAPIERFAFFDHGLELSRRNRALKIWAILKARGSHALRAAIAHNIELRHHLDERVTAEQMLEPLGSDLSISCFRWHPPGEENELQLERANRGILDNLVADGRFFLSPTTLEGRYALRVCIVNFRTRHSDMDLLVDEVLRIGASFASR